MDDIFRVHADLAREAFEHGFKDGRIQAFLAIRDATEGAPVCRHCQHSFPTWNALRNHIEYAACPCFALLQVMPLSFVETRACLVPQTRVNDPDELHLDPPHGGYISQMSLNFVWLTIAAVSGHDPSPGVRALEVGYGVHGNVSTLE